ncbi:MAG: pyruvate kinase, partial [Patescibacteria group bacterium]
MYHKKTKIVATIGPATEGEAELEKLFNHGVNVVRLNFSHGDFAEHGLRIKRTRALSKKLGLPIAILQDLAGPKIRLGEFYQERVTLIEGAKFILTTKEQVGDESIAFINYPKLPKEVKKGQIIFFDDGKKKLIVEKVVGEKIHCQILVGGETKGRRGVNVPGAYLSISSLTDKDKKDLEFGIKEGVDFMALSFVRRPEDILELRAILTKRQAEQIKIIAKIETQEAIDNLDAILAVTDAVMVARGDLAIEIPAEQVPFWQKTIITKCNKFGKPVITATQMLESMISSPVPTRAEVSDIANAIFDGTDAIMLSEETTLGKFPLKAIEVMYRVATHTEKSRDNGHFLTREHLTLKTTEDSLAAAAISMAHEIS